MLLLRLILHITGGKRTGVAYGDLTYAMPVQTLIFTKEGQSTIMWRWVNSIECSCGSCNFSRSKAEKIVGSQYKICQSRTGVCCKNRASVFFHCMWFSVSNFFLNGRNSSSCVGSFWLILTAPSHALLHVFVCFISLFFTTFLAYFNFLWWFDVAIDQLQFQT
jgi:hypothetical protein